MQESGWMVTGLKKLLRDVYEGDGKNNPSITARLALLEEQLEKISNALTKITWLIVGTAFIVIGDLLVSHLK
jgi:hypothetical protein